MEPISGALPRKYQKSQGLRTGLGSSLETVKKAFPSHKQAVERWANRLAGKKGVQCGLLLIPVDQPGKKTVRLPEKIGVSTRKLGNCPCTL